MEGQQRRADDGLGFTTKELLIEIRAEVHAVRTTLDLKADRQKVHELQNDLAAMRLLMEQRAGPLAEQFRDVQENVRTNSGRLDVIEAWKNRITGGFTVVVLFSGLLAGLLIWKITHS